MAGEHLSDALPRGLRNVQEHGAEIVGRVPSLVPLPNSSKNPRISVGKAERIQKVLPGQPTIRVYLH